MKKILFINLFFLGSYFANATIHIVTVGNFSFSPSNIPNVIVGDIIKFNWALGSHTTTCDPNNQTGTSLPAGAATWDQVITSSNNTFSYTVTKAGVYNYVCTPHASFGMIGSFTASTPLPVLLTFFKVSNVENKAFMNWQTASEENTDYFLVQKSFTGKQFDVIGKVTAAGNSSSEKNYSFTDKEPVDATHKFTYYMISIQDKDGKSNYSPVQLFKISNGNNKMILSLTNPVAKGEHVMIDFNADEKGWLDVQVNTLEGKAVLNSKMAAQKGVNMGHLHMGDLSSGTYLLKFSMNGLSESYLIVVK